MLRLVLLASFSVLLIKPVIFRNLCILLWTFTSPSYYDMATPRYLMHFTCLIYPLTTILLWTGSSPLTATVFLMYYSNLLQRIVQMGWTMLSYSSVTVNYTARITGWWRILGLIVGAMMVTYSCLLKIIIVVLWLPLLILFSNEFFVIAESCSIKSVPK